MIKLQDKLVKKVNKCIYRIALFDEKALDELYAITKESMWFVARKYLVDKSKIDDVLNERRFFGHRAKGVCRGKRKLCREVGKRKGLAYFRQNKRRGLALVQQRQDYGVLSGRSFYRYDGRQLRQFRAS